MDFREWCSSGELNYFKIIAVQIYQAMDQMKDGFSNLNPVTVMFLSFIIIVIFLSELFSRIYKPSCETNLRNSFFVLYEYNVRRVYPNQDKVTHDTLYRGVESVMRPGVSRPSVVSLISVGRGAGCTALCLVNSLAEVIMQLLNPFGTSSPNRYILKGRDFTSAEDYWTFNGKIVTYLSKYRVVVVTDFECLHPQVATVITNLVNDVTVPQPKAVIFVIIETGERFNCSDLTNSRQISATAIRECVGPFIQRRELEGLVDVLTWRCCIIVNEPSHRPSSCLVCNPPKRNRNRNQFLLLTD